MNNKDMAYLVTGVLAGLAVGFFAGRELLKWEVRREYESSFKKVQKKSQHLAEEVADKASDLTSKSIRMVKG